MITWDDAKKISQVTYYILQWLAGLVAGDVMGDLIRSSFLLQWDPPLCQTSATQSTYKVQSELVLISYAVIGPSDWIYSCLPLLLLSGNSTVKAAFPQCLCQSSWQFACCKEHSHLLKSGRYNGSMSADVAEWLDGAQSSCGHGFKTLYNPARVGASHQPLINACRLSFTYSGNGERPG